MLSGSDSANKFLMTLEECFLVQNVFFKTFQQSPMRMTNLLDLIITESNERVYNLRQGGILGDTDKGHISMTWNYAIKEAVERNLTFSKHSFRYNKGNYAAMSEYFCGLNWGDLLECDNTQDIYDKFLEYYNKACLKFIPKSNRSNKKRPPWITRELKAMLRTKYGLWQRYLRSGRKSMSILEEYKEVCKNSKKAKNRAIYKYECDLVDKSKHNPKLLYAYSRSRQQTKVGIRALRGKDGESITDRVKMAELLNEQFHSVFSVDNNLDNPVFDNRTENTCNENPEILFQTEDIEKRLSKLDLNKAIGRDGVSPHVLKNCSKQLAPVMRTLMIKSFEYGELPGQWREANVTPLFKKGSRLDPSNYRPVSLTSICCKIMEGIVRDTLMNHLISNDLISSDQHGFVRNKACVTNLLECQDVVSSMLRDGKCVDVLYTDFSKAFDKVSHKKLLIKLSAYGIRGRLLRWIESFLTDRRQCVVLGEAESTWKSVTSSVPQGGVVSSLLFVLYINDLPDVLVNGSKLYADDGKVFSEVGVGINTLQIDINNADEWCKNWSMELNYQKCVIMHFGSNNPCTIYSVGGFELRTTSAEKDLGIIITKNGKTDQQVLAAVTRANRILGLMRKTFKYFNKKLFKIIYPVFVRPHLEFASSVWSAMTKSDLKRIESIQRRATRMVMEVKTMDYLERLEELDLTT